MPWYFYLQFLVDNLFVQYHWSIPSSIYARELSFYNGKKISQAEINHELKQLGYRKVIAPKQVGEYAHYKTRYEIFTKGFRFLDKTDKPTRIGFDVKNGHIVAF